MGSRFGILALAASMVSGCYTYEPVRPGDAILDTRVRATVTPAQAVELGTALRGVTPQVTGTLVDRTDEGVMLEVPLHSAALGPSRTVYNRVAIPLNQLVGLESRRLSTWRTAVSLGAVVAAVAGGWAFIGGGDTVEDKPKTDIDNAIITIFRLPLTLFR